MRTIGFIVLDFIWTVKRLCQQYVLLAELAVLCLLLPLMIGSVSGKILSNGVGFSGIQLAVTAPEGSGLPEQIVQYLGQMKDLSAYCTVEAMEEEAALLALEKGEVTAVLQIPESFVRGIMVGENPDVRLIIGGDRPLAAMLTLWVGQSACDLLSAVQAGIYGVLDVCEGTEIVGMTESQVVTEINLRYISWTMNRQSMFRMEEITVSEMFSLREHYALCVLLYFSLASASFFAPLYHGEQIRFRRRMKAAGRVPAEGYLISVLASSGVMTVILGLGLMIIEKQVSAGLLAAAGMAAVFSAVFASFCCLVTENHVGSGVLAFLLSLVFLVVAGGVLPSVLLPAAVQRLEFLSPISWFLRMLGSLQGADTRGSILCFVLTITVLMLISGRLYAVRINGERGDR